MKSTITEVNIKFRENKEIYHGKVREVNTIDNERLVMVVPDRISCHDVVIQKTFHTRVRY